MNLFKCQSCGNLLYFENTSCTVCRHLLGYLPERELITALVPTSEAKATPQVFTTLAMPAIQVRFCANAEFLACNWLMPAESEAPLCAACRHNKTIPDVTVPSNRAQWQCIELAKHRLFYTLLKLHLRVPVTGEDAEPLAFDILADPPDPSSPRVMTGHTNGLITIALKEADDAERMALRVAMHEPYRTLLGHFRHEIGHYYWDRLVRDGGKLEACREVFGDDQQDYAAALARHYAEGAPADWIESHISAYATMHPWEDFAETWAHYLHIVDTLDTAAAFGIVVAPKVAPPDPAWATIDFDPFRPPSAQRLVEAWLPLTYAVNSLNRSMGQSDLYPFVLTAPVVRKLQFVHELLRDVQPPA